ncbi:MAG: pilus assembly protein [Actinobacteria bacterium]|nr:pilus assembly protein [Actinomycetota bacterium]
MKAGRGDRGSITAEFAVVLPAVLLVLVLGAATLGACARQVRLQDAVADAARLVARGESRERAGEAVGAAASGATMVIDHSGDLVCVTAAASAGVPMLALTVSARSCALGGGE